MLCCTLLSGTPSSLITAKDWAAKASFNSNTSTSSNVQPAFSTWVSTQQQMHVFHYGVCESCPCPLTAFLTAGMGPVPMIAGSTPACAQDTTRARGADSPKRCAAVREAITTAAAPSLIPEALPAVTEPLALSNAGLSLASPSAVVLGRGCSSSATTTGPRGRTQHHRTQGGNTEALPSPLPS